MSKCGPSKSCHDMAIDHIVMASKRAHEGKHGDAEYHLTSAKTFADMHHKLLTQQGRHAEATEYMNGVNDHFNRVRNMKNSVKKADACKSDHGTITKGDICKACGWFDKNDLAKALPPKSPSRGEIQKIGPTKDARYNFKPIHELHPHDQHLAQQKFGGKDVGAYHYPTDKQTGRLVHAARMKAPTGSPKAQAHSYNELKPHSYQELPPHHTPGATVNINSPGHEHKFGIVRPSHPEMPGKIAVQVGPSEHHQVFLEPHQVSPRKPKDRMEKALVTLHTIRKAFMKADGVNEHGNKIGTEGPTGTHAKGGIHRGSAIHPRPGGGVMVLVGSHLEAPEGDELRFKTQEAAHKHLDSLKPAKEKGPF